MKEKEKKRFVVRKYIMAVSAVDAIRRDKASPVDDVWVDTEWEKSNQSKIGFHDKSKKVN